MLTYNPILPPIALNAREHCFVAYNMHVANIYIPDRIIILKSAANCRDYNVSARRIDTRDNPDAD